MTSRFHIGVRLAVSFGILTVLAAIVGGFALTRLAQVNDNTKDIATNWLTSAQALARLSDQLDLVRRAEASVVLSRDLHEFQAALQDLREVRAKEVEARAAYLVTVDTDEEKAVARRINESEALYFTLDEQIVELAANSGTKAQAAGLYIGDSRKAASALTEALQEDEAVQKRGADAAFRQSQETYTLARMEVFGILGLATLVGACLAWLVTRSITVPLSNAVEVARRVARGELQPVCTEVAHDETGKLMEALGQMQSSLIEVVSQVRASSTTIATGSDQIAAGNADLSTRTERQAGNLQEAAATMEQLTAMVRSNADSAHAAMMLANQASHAGMDGRATVERVVRTMNEIETSARRVGDIIGLIDEIAFQTNILALNAAVEAARAGLHGRGFAVVAGEVRTLAQRCAVAAKDVRSLIEDSTSRVAVGATLASDADHAIANIAAKVHDVHMIIAKIAAASEQQSSGIRHVGLAVIDLDQVTQQNAALVEESAAAANLLRGQAEKLVGLMRFFRV